LKDFREAKKYFKYDSKPERKRREKKKRASVLEQRKEL
jgi:hypothetical protein